jgi:predicted RNA-binding protein with PIN domain
MALVRILVDGYSLLHNWRELVPDSPRHSEAARDELVHWLTRYHDATGTPITIFFDGTGRSSRKSAAGSTREIEILYSRAGQTADQMIERAAHRFAAYGEVLVVTDDHAERETVQGLGGLTSGCLNFIRTVEQAFAELHQDIQNLNRREQFRFSRTPLA